MKSKSLQRLNDVYTRNSKKHGFDFTLNQIPAGEVFYVPSSKDPFQNLGRFWAINLRTNVPTQFSPFSVIRKNNFRSNLSYSWIKIKRKFKSLMRFLRLTV
jgi:hypothetical protein